MIPPAVDVELDRPRKWRFSAYAVTALYRALGKDAFKRLEIFRPRDGESDEERATRAMDTMDECLEVFVALLWCGLVGEDKELKIDTLGNEYVGPGMMNELLPKLLEAANQSMSANPIKASPDGEAMKEDSNHGLSVVSISG